MCFFYPDCIDNNFYDAKDHNVFDGDMLIMDVLIRNSNEDVSTEIFNWPEAVEKYFFNR